MEDQKGRIVWIDMEMTGLNIDVDHILEVACIITDKELNVVSEELSMVIHQPDSVLESMTGWCIDCHNKTGLTEESRSSKISVEEAEEALLKLVQKHVPEGTCPLAGNSIRMDCVFLEKYMSKVYRHLHYRIIDVSSINELVRRWRPDIVGKIPVKAKNHRALQDIRESIQELRFYKQHIFLH